MEPEGMKRGVGWRRPRLGHIRYLNCLPLYYGLVRQEVLLDVELTRGTPTELSRLLRDGLLDLAPIPSIEYARYHRELVLLPDLAVSSDGEVRSIVLVSRVPVHELHGEAVALCTSSATSQALARIVLEERYGTRPVYHQAAPDLAAMLREARAALLIGDEALEASYRRDPSLYLYDLGREWKDMTGHKMVYAVWAVRREYARAEPGLTREVYEGLRRSMEYGKLNLAAIAREVARGETFDAAFLADYLAGLQFNFDRAYQEGLREFYTRAARLGLLPEVPRLEFLEVTGSRGGEAVAGRRDRGCH